jgi:hypothetical protein
MKNLTNSEYNCLSLVDRLELLVRELCSSLDKLDSSKRHIYYKVDVKIEENKLKEE